MSQIEVKAAAEDLPGLIERARSGEDVIIVQGGEEVAMLVPLGSPSKLPPRPLGQAEGKWQVPDDFDAPLPDDVLALFYEGPLFPPEPPSKDER